MSEPEPPAVKFKHPNNIGPTRVYSDEEVWEMRREFKAGKTMTQIAQERGCSRVTMACIIYGTDAYKNV